jgi:hypothetical protein
MLVDVMQPQTTVPYRKLTDDRRASLRAVLRNLIGKGYVPRRESGYLSRIGYLSRLAEHYGVTRQRVSQLYYVELTEAHPPSYTHGMPAFGRRHAPDTRDSRFMMRALLGGPPVVPVTRYWPTGATLDQGPWPHCVGFAWKQWLQTSPVRHAAVALDPATIYHEAQAVDEWEGTDYDGTSVRAGAKVLQTRGRVVEYRWARDVMDMADWVSRIGPVVMGTNWYASMSTPSDEGVIQLSGSIVGGHAYMITGYNARRSSFRAINSWGMAWAQRGRFWIPLPLMQRLLDEDGEACAAAERIP